jgi:hypothetical protein
MTPLTPFPCQYYHSPNTLTVTSRILKTSPQLTPTRRGNLLASSVLADDRGLWNLPTKRLLYPLDESPVLQLDHALNNFFVLTRNSVRIVSDVRPSIKTGHVVTRTRSTSPMPRSVKHNFNAIGNVSLTGIAASTKVSEECFVSDEFGVSLVTAEKGVTGKLSSAAVVDTVAFSETHPRVCYIAGEKLDRADFREGKIKEVNACKVDLGFAGLLTQLRSIRNVAEVLDAALPDTSSVYHWSAIAVNPKEPQYISLASTRSQSLGIFDLRKSGTPLAEYALTGSCGIMKWRPDGEVLIGVQCKEVFVVERERRGDLDGMADSLVVSETQKPRFSYLRGVLGKNNVVGVDWNDSGFVMIEEDGVMTEVRVGEQ